MTDFKLPPKAKQPGVITFRLSDEDATWLRQYAHKNERPTGTIARAMVEHMIRSIKEKKA